jgi:DNA-binding FadR family transcriptional regulator
MSVVTKRGEAARAPQDTGADRVSDYIVGYVRRNKLQSGAPVPSEVQLSRQLDVSRSVVREAYRALAAAGVLDVANGRSPRVGALNGRAFVQLLHHGLSTAQVSQQQVFDTRGTLEIQAAAYAAERRTDEDVAALYGAVDAMRAAGRRHTPFIEADMRFHEVIGRATGNPLFHILTTAIRESLDGTIRAGLHSQRTSPDLARVVDIHEAIADAVAARRRTKAQRLMEQHFVEASHYVFGVDRPSTRGRVLRWKKK